MNECKHETVTKILEPGQSSMAGYCVCTNCGKNLPDDYWGAQVEKMLIDQQRKIDKAYRVMDKMLDLIDEVKTAQTKEPDGSSEQG